MRWDASFPVLRGLLKGHTEHTGLGTYLNLAGSGCLAGRRRESGGEESERDGELGERHGDGECSGLGVVLMGLVRMLYQLVS